jgi:hypothetical protein
VYALIRSVLLCSLLLGWGCRQEQMKQRVNQLRFPRLVIHPGEATTKVVSVANTNVLDISYILLQNTAPYKRRVVLEDCLRHNSLHVDPMA